MRAQPLPGSLSGRRLGPHLPGISGYHPTYVVRGRDNRWAVIRATLDDFCAGAEFLVRVAEALRSRGKVVGTVGEACSALGRADEVDEVVLREHGVRDCSVNLSEGRPASMAVGKPDFEWDDSLPGS